MKPLRETSLPLELQDRIIGNLWNDCKSLSACSLVSSQWLERARKLLFSNSIAYIHARREEAAETRRFLDLLYAPHSRLEPYIYRVHILGPDTFIIARESERFFPEDYDALSSLLKAIVPRLPRVRELKLDSVTWNMISQDTKALLGSFPEVVSLIWFQIYFDRLDNLISFSSENFPKLKALCIEELRVKNLRQIERSSFSQYPSRFRSLQDLKLFAEKQIVPFLLAFSSGLVSAQHITTLEVEVREKDMLGPVGSLIKATAPTLSILKLVIDLYDPYQDFDQVPFPISLSQNINLKLLSLFTCFTSVDMIWLEGILDSASSLCGLEEIHLCFPSPEYSDDISIDSDFDFPTLERVLIGQSAPNMKVILAYMGLQGRLFSETIMGLMPELSKRGQLSVARYEYRESIL